jgi:hypothetical protein
MAPRQLISFMLIPLDVAQHPEMISPTIPI